MLHTLSEHAGPRALEQKLLGLLPESQEAWQSANVVAVQMAELVKTDLYKFVHAESRGNVDACHAVVDGIARGYAPEPGILARQDRFFQMFLGRRVITTFSELCIHPPKCLGGPLPILHKSRKIKNPPKLRNSETPTQELRKSEFPRQSFRVSEAEFPSFRGRVSESDNFGQFWRWHKKSKTLRLQWLDAFWEFSCRIFSDKSGNSEAPPQKLRNTNSEFKLVFRVSESDFPSFRVRLSEFPKVRGFRAVRVRVDSNTLGPLNKCQKISDFLTQLPALCVHNLFVRLVLEASCCSKKGPRSSDGKVLVNFQVLTRRLTANIASNLMNHGRLPLFHCYTVTNEQKQSKTHYGIEGLATLLSVKENAMKKDKTTILG